MDKFPGVFFPFFCVKNFSFFGQRIAVSFSFELIDIWALFCLEKPASMEYTRFELHEYTISLFHLSSRFQPARVFQSFSQMIIRGSQIRF